MGFSRQEYWSGLPSSTLGDLLNPGIELTSLVSPALIGGFFFFFFYHCTTFNIPLKLLSSQMDSLNISINLIVLGTIKRRKKINANQI